jgi:hypothetical protein
VDQHTGKAVLHCHFLEHEDKGCMAYLDITGTDDTRVDGKTASALIETFVEDNTATGETESAAARVFGGFITLAAAAIPAAMLAA